MVEMGRAPVHRWRRRRDPWRAYVAGDANDVAGVAKVAGRVRWNINSVIEGKDDVVTTAVTVLLAEGQLLIEDIPGVGKTMLSKALARSIDSTVRRIQFTPDLLPSDVTGDRKSTRLNSSH